MFNGDIGQIVGFDATEQTVTVDFESKLVCYDYKDLDEIMQAYAITVHKSQGSEYPVVVMPLHTQHYIMLQRNLLCTAVTRGKKLVIIVGSKQALFMAIKKNKTQKRHTRLKERLMNLPKKR